MAVAGPGWRINDTRRGTVEVALSNGKMAAIVDFSIEDALVFFGSLGIAIGEAQEIRDALAQEAPVTQMMLSARWREDERRVREVYERWKAAAR